MAQVDPALSSNPSTAKQNKWRLDTVGYSCNPSYSGDGGRRITVQSQPKWKDKTLSKQNWNKKGQGCSSSGRVACKHEALSSISTTGRKERRNGRNVKFWMCLLMRTFLNLNFHCFILKVSCEDGPYNPSSWEAEAGVPQASLYFIARPLKQTSKSTMCSL
jgi:hypothetical protein